MTNAAAIATLVSIAGAHRVVVGVGTGFTGRLSMGQRPLPWRTVAEYVEVLKALLRGETAQWEGAVIRMLHHPGFAPERPIVVPFVLAVQGPKGVAVAKEIADGVLGSPLPIPGFEWSGSPIFGTVLEEGEDSGSERAIAAAGHAAAVWAHFAMEFDRWHEIPNGERWAASYAEIPATQRHLEVHDGHLVAVNKRDRPFITGEVMSRAGVALDRAAWRERLAQFEADGATEIVYWPAGPDQGRELEAFASMMA